MKYFLVAVLVIFFLVSPAGLNYSQTASYRILPSDDVAQSEPLIVVSPINSLTMFCSCVTINPGGIYRSEGIYITTNGGLNWSGTNICNGSPITNHGGDPGIAIDKNGIFLLSHIGNGNPDGIFAHFSTNLGSNWSNAYSIGTQPTGVYPEDKGTMTVDNAPTSPYYGRTYVTGVNQLTTPFTVCLSYTTNSGISWTPYTAVNAVPPRRCSGGDVETGPNGEVYDTWAGVSSLTPFYEIKAGFAFSSNGGVNWTVYQEIFDMNGIKGPLTAKSGILVNGLPKLAIDLTNGPRRGWIYMFTGEKNISPAGSDPDILMHRSTNNGQTWSTGIRVNQDALNNGKIQYFPAPCIDSAGAINVLYYDDRNTASDSTEVYMSRSTDGGNTWFDFRVSDRRFKPKPIIGNYQGDFIGLTTASKKLFPVWMADYTNKYQIWMTIIDIDAIGVKNISTEVPKEFSLSQNYPNPFNPATKIRFSIPGTNSFLEGGKHVLSGLPPWGAEGGGNIVKLIIYDVLGKEVGVLVNEILSPGTYEIEWDAANYPSGVYYYKLIAGDYSLTKKMVLLK